MLGAGMRLMTSIALSGAEVMIDAGKGVVGDDAFDIKPHRFRSLLLTMEDSIQGKIPAILGDDEEEQVDTLVRLLRGTSEDDVSELLGALQIALGRLADERLAEERAEARWERRARQARDERRERLARARHERRDGHPAREERRERLARVSG